MLRFTLASLMIGANDVICQSCFCTSTLVILAWSGEGWWRMMVSGIGVIFSYWYFVGVFEWDGTLFFLLFIVARPGTTEDVCADA